jgi:DNA-binding XRE family transcriptional regulator
MFMETLNFKTAREKLNLTQDELAKAVGVSRQTVNRTENKESLPTKTAKDFANYFRKHDICVTFDLTV